MLDDLGKWFNKWSRSKNTHKGLAGYAVIIVIMYLVFTYWAGSISASTILLDGGGGTTGGGTEGPIDENDTWETYDSVSGSIRGTSIAIRQITDTQTFMVDDDVVKVELSIGWTGGFDLDFTLYDASGKSVGTGATQDNPEVISVSRVKNTGEWTLETVAFASLRSSSYTADITFTHEGPSENATAE